MYHYHAMSPALAGGSILLAIIGYLVVGCIVVAYFVSIAMLVKSARQKGHHRDGSLPLWFMGLFATPIVLGLYVAGLPDRAGREESVSELREAVEDLARPEGGAPAR